MIALVIAEHDNNSLKESTLRTITAALKVCSKIHILIIGYHVHTVAEEAAYISGIDLVLLADASQLADALAENIAAQILTIAVNYSHIFAPATSYGKNFLPRVAAKLNVEQISEISKVNHHDVFERLIYTGNIIVTIQSHDFIKIITVRTTSFNIADVHTQKAPIKFLEPVKHTNVSYFISRKILKSQRPSLTSAKIIVSGGRGIGSAENFKNFLEPLADKLNAAIGASRAAVDAGFASNDLQIGQTGSVVAPNLYIAIGISGAMQHLAGIREAKVIVAINKDEDAPIFSVANYGIVADFFEVIPQLLQELSLLSTTSG